MVAIRSEGMWSGEGGKGKEGRGRKKNIGEVVG